MTMAAAYLILCLWMVCQTISAVDEVLHSNMKLLHERLANYRGFNSSILSSEAFHRYNLWNHALPLDILLSSFGRIFRGDQKVFRILTLGGSVTWGTALENRTNSTWGFLFSEELKYILRDFASVEYVNDAVRAAGTVVPLHCPEYHNKSFDLIGLEFSVNGFNELQPLIRQHPTSQHFCVGYLPWLDYHYNDMFSFPRACVENNVSVVDFPAAVFPMFENAQKASIMKIEGRRSKKPHLTFLEKEQQKYKPTIHHHLLYAGDQFHLREAGHQAISELVTHWVHHVLHIFLSFHGNSTMKVNPSSVSVSKEMSDARPIGAVDNTVIGPNHLCNKTTSHILPLNYTVNDDGTRPWIYTPLAAGKAAYVGNFPGDTMKVDLSHGCIAAAAMNITVLHYRTSQNITYGGGLADMWFGDNHVGVLDTFRKNVGSVIVAQTLKVACNATSTSILKFVVSNTTYSRHKTYFVGIFAVATDKIVALQ